ncbi:MAG: MFS transporter [Gracilibacteraceae bacterium]|jgi:MFS family permease|nr:MFS transporter [Gracilibacteraceae bacterium]
MTAAETKSPQDKDKITGYMWIVLIVSLMAYVFDALEVMLYSNALVDIKADFDFNFTGSGLVMTLSLLGYGVGGIFWGPQTDKLGRIKVMIITVLGYAAFTGLTALSWNAASLIGFRFLMGFFAGGEWAAGAALLTETWPAKYRGKIMGVMQCGWPLGAILASAVYTAISPSFGWRAVFLTGVIPAVIVLFIQVKIKEPEAFVQKKELEKQGLQEKVSWTEIFKGKLLKRTTLFMLISFIGLMGYWCIITWIPTMLRTEGGLGVSATAIWFILINLGCAAGYISFGFVSDKVGRRLSFTIYWLLAMILAPIFVSLSTSSSMMLPIGVLMGASMGYFTGYPLYGSELFPTRLRATGMGIAYTGIGRLGSTLGPTVIGIIADNYSFSVAITAMASLYIIAVILIWVMGIETKGKSLEELENL